MCDLDASSLTKVQVGALRECIDLVSHGYITRFAHYGEQSWMICLVHCRIDRELIVS